MHSLSSLVKSKVNQSLKSTHRYLRLWMKRKLRITPAISKSQMELGLQDLKYSKNSMQSMHSQLKTAKFVKFQQFNAGSRGSKGWLPSTATLLLMKSTSARPWTSSRIWMTHSKSKTKPTAWNYTQIGSYSCSWVTMALTWKTLCNPNSLSFTNSSKDVKLIMTQRTNWWIRSTKHGHALPLCC